MKQGLLLKDAPETLHYLYCWNCKVTFETVYDYTQHRKSVHKEVYSYKKYVYNHRGFEEIHYYAQWMTLEDYEGRICPAPNYLPSRPTKRFNVTKQELQNRNNKKCHCGKDPVRPRIKYCSDDCANNWYGKITTVGDHIARFLDSKKPRIVKRNDSDWDYTAYYKCENCKKETASPEVDHIIAIVLRGHPWDYRNLQVLCPACHKKKTKSDIKILTWWKRESKYDSGIIDKQFQQQSILEIYS